MGKANVTRRFSNPPPTPLGPIVTFKHPFNMGVRVGKTIFTGGTVAFDDEGNPIAPNDLRGQVAGCVEYTKRIVTDLGGTLDDVVSINNFVEVLPGLKEATQAEADYFAGGAAATSVVAGINAPDLVLECESIGIVGEPKRFADLPGSPLTLDPPRFHAGVRSGNLVFVAGQMAVDNDGSVLHAGDMAAQTRVVMERIHAVLTDLGASFRDLVSMKTYYVGGEGWTEAMKVRAHYLEDGSTNTSARAASLTIPGALIQIEAVAMVGERKIYVDPPGHHAPTESPFHHGVRCGNMIFIGSQAALDSSGKVVDPGNIIGQTSVAMDNLRRVVESLDASMDDVVVYHTYYIGRENLGETIRIRSSYFKEGSGPAARGVIFEGLPNPDLKIAFGAIGVLGDR